jgi:hypothetical protein
MKFAVSGGVTTISDGTDELVTSATIH